MAVVFQLKRAYKAYGEQVLLDEVDLECDDQHRLAVIGSNGAGKSTLCKVLLGLEELDSGSCWQAPDKRVAYLRQYDDFKEDETVIDYLMRDSGQPDWRCGEVAGRFDLKHDRLHGPVSALSGGWRTRVKLASMLLAEPDLLILDEPTNFLDLRTQLLLEQFLSGWRGGALIVSHDRVFLEKTCNQTLEVSRGKVATFPQSVSDYLQAKAEKRERLQRENANLDSKRKQLQSFIDSNRANANTASQARSKAKQLARLNEQVNEIDTDERTARMVVPDCEARKGTALRCTDLRIGYGDTCIVDGITIDIERGSRVAVMGDNGQGKTTFLRTIAGSLDKLGGEARWSHGSDIGLYAQHVFGTLPEDQTVKEYLTAKAIPGTQLTTILGIAGGMLFIGDAVDKRIGVLSGGERARLVLGGLLLGRHSVLILDEPTNHLDVDSVAALSKALCTYNGTVLFVSHDRSFAGSIATDVIEVSDGRMLSFRDSYATWLHQAEQAILAQQNNKTTDSKPNNGDAQADKAKRKRQHQLDKQLRSIERRLEKWQAEVSRLDDTLASCADAKQATTLQQEREQAQTRLESAEEDWLNLQEELTAIDNN